METPLEETPGFYLLDDAEGRFEIDRGLGVISLKDQAVLAGERGAVFPARVLVIEPSGARYEIAMKLRLTGRIPQMLGAEENDYLLGLAGAPIEESLAPREPARPSTPWIAFAAAKGGACAALTEDSRAPWGALLSAPAPSVKLAEAELALPHALPAPSAAGADWRI